MHRRQSSWRVTIAAALALFGTTLLCGETTHAELNLASTPLFLTEAVPPRVLLVLSRDHEMFKEAYPDYSDLTGDGNINNTYADDFEYYGYFDPNRCYTYADGRFQPAAVAGGPNGHHCSGQWSGNFLNWATMTRMDIVRGVLYGGYRHVDTTELTVLQRELIPNSAHAFVKIFSGSAGAAVDQVTPHSNTISMCNVTWPGDLTQRSDQVDVSVDPPQLRVAQGEWPMWAATARTQCAWRGERDAASPESAHPNFGTHDLATHDVRVEVCTGGAGPNCRAYPGGTYKPIGLLQRYGENDRIHFGLLTGSYARNTSGGILRRNIGPVTGNTGSLAQENEVDPNTGIFANTQPDAQSIVNTINRLRITHWSYALNWFVDNCQDIEDPGSLTEIHVGMCTSWGNPVGEMLLEGIRYFAGASGPSLGFDADDSNYIAGLPRATWRDPLPELEFCANPNLVVLSSGITTHDAGTAASYSTAASIPGLGGGTSSVITRTNEVGAGEGLTGSYILGGANGQCTAESYPGLGEVHGVCPEGPSLYGGYRAAGLTYHAWTHDLRPEYPRQQNVRTFAVNLAEPLPRLRFGDIELLPTCQSSADGGSTWGPCAAVQTDVLATQYDASNQLESGHFRVFWEDSTFGQDYDMDGVTDFRICRGAACGGGVAAGEVRATIEVMAAYTASHLRFGVLADGSTSDGLSDWLVHSGGNDFSVLVSPAHAPDNQPPEQTFHFQPGTSTAQLLRDPLWYAAKWGGFDKEPGPTPSLVEQWDSSGDGNPDNYYLTRNPGQLAADLEEVFSEITATVSSASTIATNSTRLSTDTILYQARFNTEDWHGQLLAYRVNSDGSPGDLLWDAADLIPPHGNRKIFTLGDSGGVPFAWNEDSPGAPQLSSTQKAALDRNPDSGLPDDLGEERLHWLRGDSSLDALFRTRAKLLGDIIHSNPHFIGPLNFGYEALPASFVPREEIEFTGTTTNGYSAFTRSRIDQQTGQVLQPVIYVGSNNGMLHAFDGETGEELFAYVPGALIEHLPQLTAPDYATKHRYFMDGQVFIGDAWLPEVNEANPWRSILIGTTGAGSRTVFALDVTDPASFSADDVLWEFTHDELGYTIGKALLAPMANGRWGVVLGNGYNSNSNQSQLFVVDVADGSLMQRISTGLGDASSPNGLATPTLLPDPVTRIIQYAYAGDLHGRMWKFDVTNTNNASNWDVIRQGGTPRPLLIARDAASQLQPITSAPEIGLHHQSGHMIYFGTGKYLEVNDSLVGSNPPAQTFYGVRDTNQTSQMNLSRGDLRQQQIEYELVVAATGRDVRVTSNHAVNWSNQRGWYLDLISPVHGSQGERVVSDPVLRSGRIIFPTLTPSPNPCEGGGRSWLMELDATTGSRLAYSAFDLNNDGLVDDADFVELPDGTFVPVSGVATTEGIIQTPSIISAGAVEYKLASGTSGEVEVFRERGLHDRPRGSWRQLR